jgi:E3 ubiquitin-protein ligase BAH
MKFGHEYGLALANDGFPTEWLDSAIDYKYLKKCIKKVHNELAELGLDAKTLHHLSTGLNSDPARRGSTESNGYYAAEQPHLDSIPEEFCPQLRVLVDSKTGTPLDVTLAPETKVALQKLAKHEMVAGQRHAHLGHHATHEVHEPPSLALTHERTESLTPEGTETKWIQLPLATAKEFFDLLAPKLDELEQLRVAETEKLQDGILELGAAVENVVEPVRDGFEATRAVSYRDLYFWREMFRLYLENPVFYSATEQNRGAVTYREARRRLEAYSDELKRTGLMAKMKTPQAIDAANKFISLNLDILKIMHFQEVNSRAMTKILKKFDKQTHLEGHQFLQDLSVKYPALMPPSSANGCVKSTGASGFANSIARDMHAEIQSKVLQVVPQISDWECPVCYNMAWRPVSLGCCTALFCIRCIIKLQDEKMKRCPACNAETVMNADGRNINFEAMDFLEKYFPLECKRRQKENEKADLERRYGEEFVKPGCSTM